MGEMPAVSFCTPDSPLPENAAAALWSGFLNSIPDTSLHVDFSDYGPHCDSCYAAHSGYAYYPAVTQTKIDSMRIPDHLALVFASLIIALAATNELRDVQLGRFIPHEGHPSFGWRLTHWFLDALRRFAILGCLPSTVCSLVIIRGADTLNICLNAVAVVFALEVDNQMYEHGTSPALREWCHHYARPSLSSTDERAIGWARIASVVGVLTSILVGVQMQVLITSIERARLVALAVYAIATLPPLLAEAAARRSGRDLASMLVQFAIGYGIKIGLADLITYLP